MGLRGTRRSATASYDIVGPFPYLAPGVNRHFSVVHRIDAHQRTGFLDCRRAALRVGPWHKRAHLGSVAGLFRVHGSVDQCLGGFNPFAWQFLFSIGIFVGLKWDSRQPVLPSLAQHRWILVVACTIVLSAFTYKLFLFVSSRFGFDVAWLRIGDMKAGDMKANLSALRILHFLKRGFPRCNLLSPR